MLTSNLKTAILGSSLFNGRGGWVKGSISLQDIYTDCGVSLACIGLFWLRIGTDGGSSYECGNEPSGSIIWGEGNFMTS